MEEIKVNYKSDFKAIFAFDGGWNQPFSLRFWANSPSRSFLASYDGTEYVNCKLEEDGRLCVGFDSHNMGIGKLMVECSFYHEDDDFGDMVCDQVVSPFAPVFVDEDETEYNVFLSLEGSSTVETIGTLPAFYMKGDTGATGQRGPAGKDGKDGKDGQQGPAGKDGGVLYPSFNINSNGHLIATAPNTEADMDITINNNGHLILTI